MTTLIDPARLAAMVAVLAATVTAVTLAAAARGSSDTPAATEADRAAVTQAVTQDRRDLAARPTSAGDPTPGVDDRPPSTRDRADAQAVAAGFVEQWASVAHDEPPDDALGRIRPYVTEALADQLLADLRQPGRSGPSQLGEVTEAVVEHIHGHDATGPQMTLVVVARQRTRTIEGDTLAHPSFTVRLIRDGSRWRVHELVH
ncbi:MAG: hypothetical protein WD250_17035 [Egibacteraceae bacterium]